LSDMYWFIFPVLLPLIKEEFGLNYIQAGLLVTSFTIVTGLGSFITGYLGDRFGRRIILSGGFLIASLALMLCSKSSFYWQLLLASALVGAGASTFHPSTLALLMHLFSKRRGRVLGTFMLWGWIGSTVMLTGVSYLAGRMLTWRQMIFILAWPGLVFAPFFFRSLSFLTKGQNWQDKAEVKAPPLSQSTLSLLVIFFTAAPAPIHHTQPPGVLAVATNKKLKEYLKKFKVTLMREGNISGMNGLLLGVVKQRDMEGICLLGEIPYYTTQIENPRSSQIGIPAYLTSKN
ncbi:unnamed protein product, partial [marine sediment metagenome]